MAELPDVNADYHDRVKQSDERLVQGVHLREDILYFKDQAHRLVLKAEADAKAVAKPAEAAAESVAAGVGEAVGEEKFGG